MILLDTNVISEPLRPQPDARVVAWLDSLMLEDVYLSAITVAELRLGVALLPNGKKKNVLHERLEQSILPLFAGRIFLLMSRLLQSTRKFVPMLKHRAKRLLPQTAILLPPQNSIV